MTKPGRTAAAIAAALAIPLSLSGCADGQSANESLASIETNVASVEHVNGAFVGLTSSGTSGDGIIVNVYTDTDDLDALVAAADGSLRAIWTSSTFEPVFIHLSLAPVEKPADAGRDEEAAIDPSAVAVALDIDGAKVVHELIMVPRRDLASRYGPWQEPAK